MEINAIQNEIVAEFAEFEDWTDKYALIIELGNSLKPVDEQYKTPQNQVVGCQSRSWLISEYNDGKITFLADTEAVIGRGIVALLLRVLNGQTPDDIINCNLFFIDAIGLKDNLSPTRSNGLEAMIKQMRFYALAFKMKHKL